MLISSNWETIHSYLNPWRPLILKAALSSTTPTTPSQLWEVISSHHPILLFPLITNWSLMNCTNLSPIILKSRSKTTVRFQKVSSSKTTHHTSCTGKISCTKIGSGGSSSSNTKCTGNKNNCSSNSCNSDTTSTKSTSSTETTASTSSSSSSSTSTTSNGGGGGGIQGAIRKLSAAASNTLNLHSHHHHSSNNNQQNHDTTSSDKKSVEYQGKTKSAI